MNTSLITLAALACFTVSKVALLAGDAPVSLNTTAPNEFWFSKSEYVVQESETNLVITVDWLPGDRGYSGWVDYASVTGSASPNQDYTPVAGRLYFSGPAPRTFAIPIHADAVPEGEETIQLQLSNTSAYLRQNVAVVKIENSFSTPAIPRLGIVPAPNGGVVLSWAGQPSDYVLETACGVDGTWTEVPAAQLTTGNGGCQVTLDCAQPMSLFRLKKQAGQFADAGGSN